MPEWFNVLIQAAAGVAFPAAIAVYLLTRMEAAIAELTREITALRIQLRATDDAAQKFGGGKGC